MKQELSSRLSFLGKSLLWSLLLYTLTVVLLDWNEIATGLSAGKKTAQIVQATIIPYAGPAYVDTPKDMPAFEIKPGA